MICQDTFTEQHDSKQVKMYRNNLNNLRIFLEYSMLILERLDMLTRFKMFSLDKIPFYAQWTSITVSQIITKQS